MCNNVSSGHSHIDWSKNDHDNELQTKNKLLLNFNIFSVYIFCDQWKLYNAYRALNMHFITYTGYNSHCMSINGWGRIMLNNLFHV